MKIAMLADFEVLKNLGNGQFVKADDSEIQNVSVGGYTFEVGAYRVPFDWEAWEGGWDKDGFYSLETGRGWMFRNCELDSGYDEAYEEIGLKREEISAAFLASAHTIDDFYVNFTDKDGRECEAGYWKANGDPEASYHMKLLKVQFEDVDAERVYDVDRNVLDAFNRGEKLLGLNNVLAAAQDKCQEISFNEICKNDVSIEDSSL